MPETTLWLDSSVVWERAKLDKIAKLAREKGVALAAHPQVHLELCRQARVRMKERGDEYSDTIVDSKLEQLGVTIPTFELTKLKAQRWAATLAEWHPSDSGWQEAKRALVHAALPEGFDVAVSAPIPMTNDWLLVLDVHARGDRIATGERKKEWAALRRLGMAMTADETIAWLGTLESVTRA